MIVGAARSEEAAIKGNWEKIAHLLNFDGTFEIGHDNFAISSKNVGEDLSTGPAGSHRGMRISYDCNPYEIEDSLRDGLEDRHALSAEAEPVTRVLNIASREDAPVTGFDDGTDLKA